MPSIELPLIKRTNHLPVLFVMALCLLCAEAFAQQPGSPTPNAMSPSATKTETDSKSSSSIAPKEAAAAASAATDDEKAKAAPTPGLDPKTGVPLYETIEEDWSSLQVGNSHLIPEDPLVGQVDEEDKFTRVLVQVKWRPGDPIDLWIVLPKGVKKPPVVLYLYNFTDDTDRFRSNGWCERATSDGVAAVGFVSALSGHRFHDRPMKQWFVSEFQESLGSTVHDVKFILDYMAKRGDVDMDRVGMFGEGSGGTIAILAAAADRRIKAVDALDPWGDWPNFLGKSPMVQNDPDHAKYVTPEFLKQVAPLDPVKWLPDLKAPIRVQQVRQNETVPIECKDSVKTASPKQTEIVRFEAVTDLRKREGQGQLFEWIKAHLPQGAPAAVETRKTSVASDTAPQTKQQNHEARR